jgi:transposase
LGRSRGGFSTKIHVSVDALGNPLRFKLTGGQNHDITPAEALVAHYRCEYVIGDKAYDSASFLQIILSQGAVPVIPPRSNRGCHGNMMSSFTRSVTWWSASSTKLNTIVVSSPDLRSWPSVTWAF